MNGQFCATCGALNPHVAHFCDQCGSRLSASPGMTCPNCGVSALGGDRYCDECGSALPITAVLILEESGWRVPLPDREQVIIGRRDQYSGEQPDVDLEPYNAESHGISRRHVRIEQSQSRYLLEDLESVNLTYVNDQRLEAGRQIELRDRDRIVMGSLDMMIRLLGK